MILFAKRIILPYKKPLLKRHNHQCNETMEGHATFGFNYITDMGYLMRVLLYLTKNLKKYILLFFVSLLQVCNNYAVCQNDIRLSLGLDSSVYHNGTVFFYADNCLLYSDFEWHKFYDVKLHNNLPLLSELFFKDKNGDTAIYSGYLFLFNNFYYIINEESLWKFTTQGNLVSKKDARLKALGIRYFPKVRSSAFKVEILDSATIVFPVGFIHSFDVEKNLKKYKSAKALRVFNVENSKSFLLGNYDSLFSKFYYPNLNTNRFQIVNGKIYTFKYFESIIDEWEQNGNLFIKSNSIKVSYKPVLPPTNNNDKSINDLVGAVKFNRQIIESSNLNDFFLTPDRLFLIQSPPQKDTCLFGEVLEKPKGLCGFTSPQQRNQWIQLFHKTVVLTEFDLFGNFITESILNILNNSEVKLVNEGYFVVMNRYSQLGNPEILKIFISK
ncbi:MAG: hypothetical protein SGJ00_04620 [bacterium]|nr:hypothetical protein [bacterium]